MKSLLYIFILLLFSCQKKEQKDAEMTKERPLLSIVKKHHKIVQVKPIYKKEIEGWEELQSVHSFVIKFSNTSANEALSNALELKDLVKSLKDSINPKFFDTRAFNARINVLDNEVLRLADLTYISAATSEEIHSQIDKVLISFSSVNAKINTIFSQKYFEDAIEIDIDFLGIDSTKIDSISKKSIYEMSKNKAVFERKNIKNIH